MNAITLSLGELATTSLLVSLLIAVFLPLRPLLRRAIGSRWLCVLWLALLVRMLMPWPLESRWGLFNFRAGTKTSPVAVAATSPWKISASVKDGNGAMGKPVVPTMTVPVKNAQQAGMAGDLLRDAWLAGIALSLGVLAWRWHQTRRLAARTLPVDDARLRDIFEAIPARLRGDVELRMTDALDAPTLAGVLRPQIWMPLAWPAQFTDEELRNVLLHELGHARRSDLAVQWLFAIAQCFHWFNPLAWLAARASRFDREMACDAWVLAHNGADSADYGATLVKTVQLLRAPPRLSPASVAMATSRQSLHARISGIGAFRPVPAWRGMAGILLMAASLVAVTTSRMRAQDAPAPPVPSAPGATPAAAATATPAPDDAADAKSERIHVQCKIVEIDEAAWKKMCNENPEFKTFGDKYDEIIKGDKFVDDLDKETGNTNGEHEKGIMCEAMSAGTMAKMMDLFNKGKHADLLSSPSVITKNGENALIEMVREYSYPTAYKADNKTPAKFESRNVGLSLTVRPKLGKNGEISLLLSPEITALTGFMVEDKDGEKTFQPGPPKAGKVGQPVFSTAKLTTELTVDQTQTVLLGLVRNDTQVINDKGSPPREVPIRRLVLLLVSAKVADTAEAAVEPVDEAHVPKSEVLCNIFISRDGVIKLEKDVVSVDQLPAQLAALQKAAQKSLHETGVVVHIALVIHAGKALPVEKLSDVFDAAKRAGVTKVGVQVNPELD